LVVYRSQVLKPRTTGSVETDTFHSRGMRNVGMSMHFRTGGGVCHELGETMT